jgi:glucose/arabinose dehydrogenase
MPAPCRGLFLVAAAGLACGAGVPSAAGPSGLALEPVASGLAAPLYLTAPPGDTARLFVVEQGGRVRIVAHGRLLAAPFLDLTARVSAGGERGLLSLAFHPDFAANGYFYVDYTDVNGDTRVERYTVSGDPDVADTASRTLVLFVPQPYPNHNGGLVLFGPDGKLYIGLGDGGSGGDPQNRAQNPDSLLGKLLRLDVDAGEPYAIPPDNPFARGGGAPEVWALGLRNPWRFAFDRASGLLYIADVGQDAWEEVDVAPAGRGGANYGWRIMEGAHCYGPDPCRPAGLVPPALEYSHAEGCAVVGGAVYRGTRYPALAGHYFYADLCGGWVRSFTYAGGVVTGETRWALDVPLEAPLSFGEDARGELYVLSGAGTVYHLAPR